jgi:hypothetical protein
MSAMNRTARKQGIWATAMLLCAGVVTLLWTTEKSAAQSATAIAAPIKPVISVNVLMVKFVDQAADAIWTAAVHPPKRACEWQQVEYRATQLATTGTLLRVGGTGPLDTQWSDSPRWTFFADKMSSLALTAAQAARDKDVAAMSKVGDALIQNCEACHRQFKPEIPTQNISTQLSHAVPLAEDLPPNCRAKRP